MDAGASVVRRVLLSADPEIPVPPRTYGGIERIVNSLVAGLRGRGVEVGLLAHPDSACPADAKWGWRGRRSQDMLDTIANARQLARVQESFGADVVHSFSRLAYLLPLLRGSVPLVMSYQRQPTRRTVHLAQRLARDNVLSFTGCSEYIAGAGRAITGLWEAIPNFADMENFDFCSTVPPDAPLVFLSRVESIKGADWAIEIARRSGRRLVIAGNHATDGAEGRYWRDMIEPRIRPPAVEYVGPVDDARKNWLLGRALAMIVPIQWDEPFGIVFAEALACGTPIISCPRGALPEIVREGVDGFLVRSIEEGCIAVGNVATLDRRGCRERAETAFSKRTAVARYIDLYNRRVGKLG